MVWAPQWAVDTMRWISLAVISAIISGTIGGMILKTWWDLKLLPRWREHRDRQHIKNLLAHGRVLRVQFQTRSPATDPYTTPIQNHPALLDRYNIWFNHCDRVLAVLSSRWHRRWWLDGSRLTTSFPLDPNSVGSCLMALDQGLTILQNCYEAGGPL